jgi:succinate dehydrogenase/fumarate reductase flavoprotein subunit
MTPKLELIGYHRRKGEKEMGIASKELTTDVLVIGSGISGSFAAIRARALGASVVMLEQGKSGYSGMSPRGTHRMRVLSPNDDFETAMKATVMECEYMIDQEFLELALREAWDRFQDLLNLGASFRKDDDGEIKWFESETDYPWLKQRMAMWEPLSSHKHILKIRGHIVREAVEVFDRILVTDLLISDGKVKGAVGFNTREGDFYLFKAKAVIVATGTFSGGGACHHPSLTGDGIAMALRAGAALRGMEFGKTETGQIPPPPGGPIWIYPLAGPPIKEVKITNAKGEEFLEKYELGKRQVGRRYYGPPWRVQVMAMFTELKEGRGPCYVDYRSPNIGSRLREFWGSYYDLIQKQIDITGTTLDKIKYELAVSRGYSGAGGVRTNIDGESSVPGLFAGGIASDIGGNAQYTYLSGFPGAMVTGYRAGEGAAKYALSQSEPIIDAGQADSLKKQIYAPLDRGDGKTSDEIRRKLIRAWVNVDIRNDSRLKKAHEEFQVIAEETSKMVASDFHELKECHKIKNYIECSDAVALAALARCETRLEHIREDYPLTDNKDWLKWVIVRRVGKELKTELEDIPINRWKYKPERTVFDRLRPSRED